MHVYVYIYIQHPSHRKVGTKLEAWKIGEMGKHQLLCRWYTCIASFGGYEMCPPSNGKIGSHAIKLVGSITMFPSTNRG